MKKYTAAFSYMNQKWCVFEQQTESLRVVFKKCGNKEEAEKLADKLNQED